MSGQLRTLRNRIRSVENTKKITRAMEMVAAAKLRKFQDMMTKSRAFTEGLENLLKRLSGGPYAKQHPFMNPGKRQSPKAAPKAGSSLSKNAASGEKTALVLMTSDAGLCGSYNNDLLAMAHKFAKSQAVKPVYIAVGKSGITASKSLELTASASFVDIRASRVEEILTELRITLENFYLSGEVDSIYVIYSHFKNLTTYKAVTEKLLPLEAPQADAKALDDARNYIFEPSPEKVFERLVPLFFEAKVRMIFLEAIVSEQIARMTAMNLATKNAKEMIDTLVLQRNKARQASITKELIEIVSGSQALKLK